MKASEILGKGSSATVLLVTTTRGGTVTESVVISTWWKVVETSLIEVDMGTSVVEGTIDATLSKVVFSKVVPLMEVTFVSSAKMTNALGS